MAFHHRGVMDLSYGGVLDLSYDVMNSSDGGVVDSSYGGVMAPLYGLGDLTNNFVDFHSGGQSSPVPEGQREELEQPSGAAEHLSPAQGTSFHESYWCVDVPLRCLTLLMGPFQVFDVTFRFTF
jgi:hypothetical protein